MKRKTYEDELYVYAEELYSNYREFDDGTNEYENEAYYCKLDDTIIELLED